MTANPTTILQEAIADALHDQWPEGSFAGSTSDADAVLATRIPQACQTCKGEGWVGCFIHTTANGWNPAHHSCQTACPDCPTIGTLLLYGWNVEATRVEGGQVSVSGKLWMTAPNLLAALREVPT